MILKDLINTLDEKQIILIYNNHDCEIVYEGIKEHCEFSIKDYFEAKISSLDINLISNKFGVNALFQILSNKANNIKIGDVVTTELIIYISLQVVE